MTKSDELRQLLAKAETALDAFASEHKRGRDRAAQQAFWVGYVSVGLRALANRWDAEESFRRAAGGGR